MEWIFLGFILLALYLLLIQGILYKIIVLIFGWAGMYYYLEGSYPASKTTFMTIMDCHVSWSMFIPSIIVILAMATTKVKE